MADVALTKSHDEVLALAATDRSALRAAGWTPGALRAAGWTPGDLIAAGWTPGDLRAAGWTPGDLIAAGWTPGALRAAGWTPGDLIAAGWTPGDLRAAGWTPGDLRAFENVPAIENLYSRLLDDITAHRRVHKQSTWGPENPTPELNICKTPMCTAGHLVSMAGESGWNLKRQFGWEGAARLIHDRAHPGWPPQNYGAIPDEWALAWIRTMAAHEKNGTTPIGYVAPLPSPPEGE
jgi:hypothetical protein